MDGVFKTGKNNYINITNYLALYGKKYNNWRITKSSKYICKKIAIKNNIKISDLEFYVFNAKKVNDLYIHVDITPYLIIWCNKPKNNLVEFKYKTNIYNFLMGYGYIPKKEFKLSNGKRIDILTQEYIIEIKNIKNWTAAIGQILNYSLYLPNCKLVLILFGNSNNIENIIKICNMCKIIVIFDINEFINLVKK